MRSTFSEVATQNTVGVPERQRSDDSSPQAAARRSIANDGCNYAKSETYRNHGALPRPSIALKHQTLRSLKVLSKGANGRLRFARGDHFPNGSVYLRNLVLNVKHLFRAPSPVKSHLYASLRIEHKFFKDSR